MAESEAASSKQKENRTELSETIERLGGVEFLGWGVGTQILQCNLSVDAILSNS